MTVIVGGIILAGYLAYEGYQGYKAYKKGKEEANALKNRAAQDEQAAGIGAQQEVAAEQFVLTENRATKIFGTREGHIPDTPANREMLQKVANDPATKLGTDKYGNVWSGKKLPDGTQAWTQSRDGQIWNGGINQTPRTFSPETGLASPTRPGWK